MPIRAKYPGWSVALICSAFVAVTYGLARFVFGLFLPTIRSDMGFGADVAGIIGAVPFATFVPASLLAPKIAQKLGPKLAAGLAGSFAVSGLGLISIATGPLLLGIGVGLCGVATGLSLPTAAQAVSHAIPCYLQGRANAVINAGTSIGIASAGPALLWYADIWRPTYAVFAGIALLILILAFYCLPRKGNDRQPSEPFSTGIPEKDQWKEMFRLGALACAMGFVSSIYWIFAPDYVVNTGMNNQLSAWLWVGVGLAGLIGSAAGDLVDRHGPAISHAFAFAVMAGGLTLLSDDPGNVFIATFSSFAFGAAYMTLTGVYIVEGTKIMWDSPALGPVIPTIAVAVGQMLGSPVAGWMITKYGYEAAFGTFAIIGFLASVASLDLTKLQRAKPYSR